MATITKRGDTYRIRTSCGYTVDGKQVVKSMTYRPREGMSEHQIQKEVNKQAVLFEESCKKGQTVTAAKFETFAKEWLKDYAELKLKRLTLCAYHNLEKRTYAALGHIRVDRISPLDIQKFVTTLRNDGLAPSTIKGYVRFVSVILNYAVKKRIITYNPCVTVDYPEAQETDKEFYTIEDVETLLRLLWDADEAKRPMAVFFTLAAYLGCRKGELLGLEWKDIDFNNSVVSIRRAYYYSSAEHTSYTDTPKTKRSRRSLKAPVEVMDALRELQAWQNGQRELFGGSWVETDRLFTKPDGSPMSTSAPYNYLQTFTKRMGLPKATVHSFRHFNASVLIAQGVDIVAVQTALGHSTPSTTLNIYSHAFDDAQTRAMEAVATAINFKQVSLSSSKAC